MTLRLLPPPKPRASTALVRKALTLFRSEFATREQRHANARAWLRSVEFLGNGHVLRGGEAKWSGRRT